MKEFKLLLASGINRLLSYIIWLILPVYYYLFFWRIRPEGKSLVSFAFEKYDGVYNTVFYGVRHSDTAQAAIIYAVTAIIGLALFVAALAGCVVVPVLIIGMASEHFGIISRNRYNDFCYQREERLGLEHKQRETGEEWAERREKEAQAAKDEKKRQKQILENEASAGYAGEESLNQHWWNDDAVNTQAGGQTYQNRNYNYQNESNYNQNQRSEDDGEGIRFANKPEDMNELEKAKIAFFLDGVNLSTISEERLKEIRNKLIKEFHPDGSDDEMYTQYTQKINHYFKVLKENL